MEQISVNALDIVWNICVQKPCSTLCPSAREISTYKCSQSDSRQQSSTFFAWIVHKHKKKPLQGPYT